MINSLSPKNWAKSRVALKSLEMTDPIVQAVRDEREAFAALSLDNQRRFTVENDVIEFYNNMIADVKRGKILSRFSEYDNYIDLCVDISYYYFEKSDSILMEKYGKIGDYIRDAKRRWPDGTFPKTSPPKSSLIKYSKTRV